jgi:hypothetical protein
MQGANNMQVDERFAAFFEAQFAKKLGSGSDQVIPTAAAQSSSGGVNIPRKATTIPAKKQPLVKAGSSLPAMMPIKKQQLSSSSSTSSVLSSMHPGAYDGSSVDGNDLNEDVVSPSGEEFNVSATSAASYSIGGGNGSDNAPTAAQNGGVNQGGGGGGGLSPTAGANGGSGIVILRAPKAADNKWSVSPGTNTKTTAPNGDVIATFTVDGNLVVS